MPKTVKSKLSTDSQSRHLQVISPPAKDPILAVTGEIDITPYNLIMFDEEVVLYFNGESAKTFKLAACVPIGITDGFHLVII